MVCIIRAVCRVSEDMKCILLTALLAVAMWGQSPQDPPLDKDKPHRGAGKEIGSGAGDIGKGTAKGAGNLAKGAGKSAADLATLHPVNAATSLGKGAGEAGKDLGVGTAKGTAKIGKGVGKALKHIF
jgi:hypothetical protein